MEDEQDPVATTFKDFDELDIDPNILRGIYAKGFENPSPIQQKAILPILSGRDVIAQAQSGTGKTATFSIGSLSKVDLTKQNAQVLILSPTRELTLQTAEVVNDLGVMMPGLKTKTLVGGVPVSQDKNDLKRNCPHIIIGCPGRVYDMIIQRAFDAQTIKLLVLDEADNLLAGNFEKQICDIFRCLHEDVQCVLFSATFTDSIMDVTQRFMRNPYTIRVAVENLSLEGIEQFYCAVQDDDIKAEKIKILYEKKNINQSIIFANSVDRVRLLTSFLKDAGFGVTCIHGSMDKSEREDVIRSFKTGNYRILVSSDLISRGLDVQQVSVVVNFDIPRDVHSYLHRIGRSGRWGRNGIAINFVTPNDISKIEAIERYYKTDIKLYADLA
jgi:translation initiation factor 4A